MYDRSESFFWQLRRRRVPRVLGAYVLASLAAVEAADLVFPRLGLPDWTVTLVLVLALAGLPVTVALAWAFQVTPQGIRTHEAGDRPPARVPGSRRPGRTVPVVVFAGLAAGAGAILFLDRGEDVGLPMDRVAVLPFENLTGIDTLSNVGRWAADWISQEMTGHGIARVVPARVVISASAAADSMRLAGADLLQYVAAQTGAGVLISGALYREGDRLVFHATITDANKGEAVRTVEPVSASLQHPSEAFVELRERVGGLLGALLDSQFADFTRAMGAPPSYAAFQEYLRGRELFGQARWDEALGAFERSVVLDSTYAAPVVYQAFAHLNAGRRDTALAIGERASGMDLAPFERAWLDLFHATARQDTEAALQAALRVRSIAPGSRVDYDTGLQYYRLGMYRSAADSLAVLDPTSPELRDWVFYWTIQLSSLHLLGRYDEELRTARRARQALPDRRDLYLAEARALAGLGRVSEALAVASEGMTRPGLRGLGAEWLAYSLGAELKAHGHSEAADSMYLEALAALEERPGAVEGSRAYRLNRVSILKELGRLQEADELLAGLRQEAPNDRSVVTLSGVVAALAGREAEARQAISLLAENDGTPYQRGDHLFEAALVAAQLPSPDEAVALLDRAFREGFRHGVWTHNDPDLLPLHDDPAYRRLVAPRD